ncbi:hypothetical protein D3C76_1679210 [compost metagenome]
MAQAINGKGKRAARVSFQLMTATIITRIVPIKMVESDNVRMPKPTVVDTAFKSLVARAIRSPVRFRS